MDFQCGKENRRVTFAKRRALTLSQLSFLLPPPAILSRCQREAQWIWVVCPDCPKCRITTDFYLFSAFQNEIFRRNDGCYPCSSHPAHLFVVLPIEKLLFWLPKSQQLPLEAGAEQNVLSWEPGGCHTQLWKGSNNLSGYEFFWHYFQSNLHQEQSCTRSFLWLKKNLVNCFCCG